MFLYCAAFTEGRNIYFNKLNILVSDFQEPNDLSAFKTVDERDWARAAVQRVNMLQPEGQR